MNKTGWWIFLLTACTAAGIVWLCSSTPKPELECPVIGSPRMTSDWWVVDVPIVNPLQIHTQIMVMRVGACASSEVLRLGPSHAVDYKVTYCREDNGAATSLYFHIWSHRGGTYTHCASTTVTFVPPISSNV